MTNTLLVPMYVDALYLPRETNVLGEMTDYTKLPYYQKDNKLENRERSFVSETVLSIPFKQPTLPLKAGIHLHWTLPDALTNGIVKENEEDRRIKFPLVPNRWLIIRRGGNKQEKTWVVESDYLHHPESPISEDTRKTTINIYYHPNRNQYQPYRLLGRKLTLQDWKKPRGSRDEYIPELTAIGPFAKVDSLDNEKAGFAGFYPNCRSVFGFHDQEITTATPPTDLQYDVIGWYSDGTKDYLSKFIQEHSEEQDPQSLLEILQEKAGWTVEIANNQNFPRRLLCHGSLKFKPGTTISNPQARQFQGKIAVGNTQEEAISAYLADTIDTNPQKRKILEEQLEALQMSGRLEQQQLDFGAKFQETLHENGFIGQSKEILWQVVPESNTKVSASGNANPANAVQGEGQAQVTLSSSIGDRINEVNGLQREYHQKLAKIASIREQVYADWYKYTLVSAENDTQILDRELLTAEQKERWKETSDKDIIKAFLEEERINNEYGLKALEAEIKSTGVLSIIKNDQGEIIEADAPNFEAIIQSIPNFNANLGTYRFDSNANAVRLAQSINTLIAEVGKFNKESRFITPNNSKITVTGTDKFSLVPDDIAGKCLDFKETQNCQVSGLHNIESISMWINIPDNVNGSLLDVSNSQFPDGWVISSHKIGGKWKKICINGKEIAPSAVWSQIPRNQWILLYLQVDTPFSGTINLMSKSSNTDYLQGRIASVSFQTKPLLPAEIEQSYRDKIGLLRPSYIVKIVPGSRYWQPGEPVILMTGDVVKPTRDREDERVREDELLQCQLSTDSIDLTRLPDNTLTTLKRLLNEFAAQPSEKIGFRQWKDQPWNPFLLEWNIQLTGLGHRNERNTNYDLNIFQNNYELRVNGLDITPRSTISGDYFATYPDFYSGASFLSASAGILLKDNLTDYLKKYLLPEYYQAHETKPDEQTEGFLSQNFDQIKRWYEQKNPLADDPIYTALRADQQLQSLNSLAQSIGGFSDALLTYNRTMQLEVEANPRDGKINISRQFVERVRNGLSIASVLMPESLLRSPYLLYDFSPIRTGALRITNLRLVDTFGQVNVLLNAENVESTRIITSQTLTPPENLRPILNVSNPIYLPPRLTQSARLNFRWLSATKGAQEMNDSPTTSLICGWILPNNLDNSLTIYDNLGNALVVIDRRARLQSIPGRDFTSEEIAEIIANTNPYLKQMVRSLRDQGEAFFTDFLTTVNKALETIDPEGFAQNQAISLLVARPLALVRAQVNLEIPGIPVVSQNAVAFTKDVFTNKTRTTDNFEKIKFPIRIGEYQQFNDGLVGYWLETAEGTYKDNTFYAPQSCYVPHPKIKTLFDNATDQTPDTPINLEQTLEANTAQTLVMLIDPRGQVNASCGILPAKRISIPPEQYVPALQSLAVTFLSAPLLSDLKPINDLDQIYLSLPEVPGYEWSWLGKDGNNWSTCPLHPIDSQSTFSSPQKIYDGWLKLSRKTPTHE